MPRHTMRVIAWQAIMLAGDRSRGAISPASIVASLAISQIVCFQPGVNIFRRVAKICGVALTWWKITPLRWTHSGRFFFNCCSWTKYFHFLIYRPPPPPPPPPSQPSSNEALEKISSYINTITLIPRQNFKCLSF